MVRLAWRPGCRVACGSVVQFGTCRAGETPGVVCAHGGIGCAVDHRAEALRFLRGAMQTERMQASSYSDQAMQVGMQQTMDFGHLQNQVKVLAMCVEFLLSELKVPVKPRG